MSGVGELHPFDRWESDRSSRQTHHSANETRERNKKDHLSDEDNLIKQFLFQTNESFPEVLCACRCEGEFDFVTLA